MVGLNDSPRDRAARNEALIRIGRRLAIALGAYAVAGLLAFALGVPGWIVLATGVVVIGLVLTTT